MGLSDKYSEETQTKTFVKWVNSVFEKGGKLPVKDVTSDFRTGVKLCELCEVLYSDERRKLGRWNKKPRMLMQEMENITLALRMLKTKGVKLVNVGPKDVHDGNVKLILGLMWSVIYKVNIEGLEIKGKSGNDALLEWAREQTAGYKGVDIRNIDVNAFQDGLAFNAILDAAAPGLFLNFEELSADDRAANLKNAFDIAEREWDVPQLIDVDDVLSGKLDRNSLLAYVAELYHGLKKDPKNLEGEARRKQQEHRVLHWLQEQTADYANVDVRDLSESLRDGLALQALLDNQHRGRYTDFAARAREAAEDNVRDALEQFEKYWGVSAADKHGVRAADVVQGAVPPDAMLAYLTDLEEALQHKPNRDVVRADLIDWLAKQTAGYTLPTPVTDLDACLADGVAMNAVLDCQAPGLLCDPNALDPQCAAQNVQQALRLAKQHWGVPDTALDARKVARMAEDEGALVDYFDELRDALEARAPTLTDEQRKVAEMLEWAKEETEPYPTVPVTDLVHSLDNGLALSAMLHNHRDGDDPRSIGGLDFHTLHADDALPNIKRALETARRFWGVEPDAGNTGTEPGRLAQRWGTNGSGVPTGPIDAEKLAAGKEHPVRMANYLEQLRAAVEKEKPVDWDKEKLIESVCAWVADETASYDGVDVKSLRDVDGVALHALLDHQAPGRLGFDFGDLDNEADADKLANVNNALDLADKFWGVGNAQRDDVTGETLCLVDAERMAQGAATEDDVEKLARYLDTLRSAVKKPPKLAALTPEQTEALRWLKRETRDYPLPVRVKDLGPSLKDGLALCAAIDHQAPGELIRMDKLPRELKDGAGAANVREALAAAEKYYGVKPTLDADAVAANTESPAAVADYCNALRDAFKKPPYISPEERKHRDLLKWAQDKTAPYDNVHVDDLGPSFRDGLALHAILDQHAPEKTDPFDALDPANARDNVAKALDDAERLYKVPRDGIKPEDIACEAPDEALVADYLDRVRRALVADAFNQMQLTDDHEVPQWTCYTIELEGAWEGEAAGGSPAAPTFRLNPMFTLRTDAPTKLVAVLKQDVNDVAQLAPKALHVVRPSSANEFGLIMPLHSYDVVNDPVYGGGLYATYEMELEPTEGDDAYMLVCSLQDAGLESRFVLTLHSDHPVTVEEWEGPPGYTEYNLKGAWSGITSGGMHDLNTWRYNPQFKIELATGKPTRLHMMLSLGYTDDAFPEAASFLVVANEARAIKDQVAAFHSIRGEPEGEVIQTDEGSGIVSYVEGRVQVEMECVLEGDDAFFLVPSTWDAGCEAEFLITLFASEEVYLFPTGHTIKYPEHESMEARWEPGKTAGGSRARWRTNPQYRLTVHEPTELSVVVTRLDLTMKTEGDIMYMARKHIGMNVHVVQNKDIAFEDELLPGYYTIADVGSYIEHAEVNVNLFLAEPGTYFLVPSTYAEDIELPFRLDVHSDVPVGLARVEREVAKGGTVVQGEWAGASAGGRPGLPTYKNNPLYTLTSSKDETVSVVLTQGDAANLVAVGMRVFANNDASFGSVLTPDVSTVGETKRDKFNFFMEPEVSCEVSLKANVTYFVRPTTFDAGVPAKFTLSVMRGSGCTLAPCVASSANAIELSGAFAGASAGGRPNMPTYRNNPQFALTASEPCTLYVAVAQDANPPKAIGLQVLQNASESAITGEVTPDHVVRGDAKKVTDAGTYTHATTPQVSVKMQVTEPGTFFVLPSLFEAGMETTFTLSVLASAPVKVAPVQRAAAKAFAGEWKGESAGGCSNDVASFVRNPQFRITATAPTRVCVCVAQQIVNNQLAPMGVHLVRDGAGSAERVSVPAMVAASKMQGQYTYAPLGEVCVEADLSPADGPVFAIPSMWEAGRAGSFVLSVITQGGDVQVDAV